MRELSIENRSQHCPVIRPGPALGCNFCWNTIDDHGRILRRKTKYHCPECQTNLCIVPCFQQYHEKQPPSNESNTSGGGGSIVAASSVSNLSANEGHGGIGSSGSGNNRNLSSSGSSSLRHHPKSTSM